MRIEPGEISSTLRSIRRTTPIHPACSGRPLRNAVMPLASDRVLLRLLVVAVALAPRLAGADATAPSPAPTLSAIAPAGATTPLTIDSASLRIDCESRDTCAVEVRYAISNPTDAPLDSKPAFDSTSTHDLKVTVDGAPANVTNDGARQRVAIAVGPRATAKVIVTGTLAPTIRRAASYFEWTAPADIARHLVLAPHAPELARVQLDYVVLPLRRWGAAPKAVTVTLVLPTHWHPSLDGAQSVDASRSADGRTIHEATVPTSIHTLAIDLFIGEIASGPHGGLFAGIGGNVDNATGIRTRVGGELAWRHHYFTSLALEIEWDAPRSYVIVPAVAVATSWLVFLPSVGVGVGVPMRVSPSLEVGARIQLDVHVGALGYFVAFDGYPGMDAGPRRFEVSMMGVLSI